jgi:hypothetical protein
MVTPLTGKKHVMQRGGNTQKTSIHSSRGKRGCQALLGSEGG